MENLERFSYIIRAPDKKGYQGLLMDNFPYFSIKTYLVTLR